MKYVLSDIHGYWKWFVRMFGLDGHPGRISLDPDDEVYVIGDCADRGPDGVRIWNYIRSDPRFYLILGNHELMAAESFGGTARSQELRFIWRHNGGKPTMDDMLAMPAPDRECLISWLRQLPEWLDVDAGGKSYRLVHAGWSEADQNIRLWDRPSPYKPMYADGRDLIIGHTPACYFQPIGPTGYLSKCGEHMRIFRSQHFTAVDCGCGSRLPKQALACLRLDDDEEFYVYLHGINCADPMGKS